jgi:DNA-3-methyladenine glycosylase II
VAAHGQAPPSRFEMGKAFPRAAELACASIPSLRSLGFSNHKSAAIIEIASAIGRGEFQPDQLGELDDDTLLARLDQLRGVGRWTAEYVLLRGYGRLNIFPGDDIGAQNSLKRWLGLRRSLDYDRTNKILRQWRPYCGLIYLHLLLKYLEEREMF